MLFILNKSIVNLITNGFSCDYTHSVLIVHSTKNSQIGYLRYCKLVLTYKILDSFGKLNEINNNVSCVSLLSFMVGWRFVTVTIVVLFGNAAQNGYNSVVINLPANHIREWIKVVYSESYGNNLSEHELDIIWSALASVKAIGLITGSLLGGWLSDRIGRKWTIIFSALPSIMGYLVQLSSKALPHFEFLVLGRLICSLGTGTGAVAVNLFLCEIAPVQYRGTAGFAYFFFTNFGETIGFTIMTPGIFGTSQFWHYGFLVPCLFAVPLLVVFPFYPDSPRFLFIKRRDRELAMRSLKFYQTNDQMVLQGALEEMELEWTCRSRMVPRFGLLQDKSVFKALVLTFAVVLAKCMSGYTIILTFSSDILRSTGTNAFFAKYASALIGPVSLVATGFSLWLVEIWGRRPLMIFSCCGMLTAFGVLILADLVGIGQDLKPYPLAFAIYFWAANYSIGIGPAGYSFISEIWDQGYRASAQSLAMTLLSVLNLVLTVVTPTLLKLIGAYIFVFLSFFLGAATLYLIWFCPETKDRLIIDIITEINGNVNRELIDDKLDSLHTSLNIGPPNARRRTPSQQLGRAKWADSMSAVGESVPLLSTNEIR